MIEELLRFAHVIGATVLLGTGAGIAFFMVMSHRSHNPSLIAHVAGIVVVADTIFTATAAIIQPITGTFLAWQIGWSLWEPWLLISLFLYVLIGVFWLPVVWMQLQMRNLARMARDTKTALPDRYFTLYRLWFAFGFPAFFSVIAIVWLMLTKPAL